MTGIQKFSVNGVIYVTLLRESSRTVETGAVVYVFSQSLSNVKDTTQH